MFQWCNHHYFDYDCPGKPKMPVTDSIEMTCCIIVPSFIAKHCKYTHTCKTWHGKQIKKTLKDVADIMTFSCTDPTSFGYCPVRYQQPVPVRTRITQCCWLAGQPMYPKSSGQLISSSPPHHHHHHRMGNHSIKLPTISSMNVGKTMP